ncbi:MAG: hypothetical protein AAB964_01895 [Patescibacteria group bacterium]
MHNNKLVAAGAGIAMLLVAGVAFADTLGPIGFESPTYAVGTINGQDGWSKTGAYDVAVVANSYSIPAFGSQVLRISNAVTSGSFGDQTFSKPLVNEAGETDALNGGMSGGTRQNHFEAQFDLASTMTAVQPGLMMSVSPDRGDGARMSYLRFEDQSDGIHVFFDDVQGTSSPANFVETALPVVSRAPHTVKFVIDFVDGPSNDVVKIYIDSVLVHTGTTWENYFRFDPESNPSLVSNSRTVDSLLFRTAGAAAPANAGNGFLVDNVSLVSSTPLPPPAVPTDKDQCKKGGWQTLADDQGNVFKNQGQCVSFVETQKHEDDEDEDEHHENAHHDDDHQDEHGHRGHHD